MASASALRIQIEHALEHRFPAALTPVTRTVRETASVGIAEIDRLLGGGLPVGAISEITGQVSSGRTSLALAFVAARTREDRVCAWVDAHDALDAESAAASGVVLRRLLWVRCRNPEQERTAPFARMESGQGAARPLSTKPWARLDQALRATDLLLQAGGFASLVLDLGSTAPEHGKRIPPATWFRFRQAADRTHCSLLVLAEEPLAQSSAALVLECAPRHAVSANETVLTGGSYQVRTGRVASAAKTLWMSNQRKPPAAEWHAGAAWQREDTA